MYFTLTKIDEPEFNRKKVNGFILRIQKSNNERLVANLKFELFKMMKKIVVKNVANYQMLMRNSSVSKECMEQFEIETECYIVLDKCVSNYKVSPTNCFYFYYNKSLTRSLFRMFQKEVRTSEKFQEFHKSESHKSSSNDSTQYDIDFLITFLNLNKIDIMILKSKLINEKKDAFLERKPRISPSQYQNSIKKIKEQIVIFNEDEK